MSEKTDVRVWGGLGASVVLLFDAIVFYFMKSELLGPLFTGNVLGNALVASLILIFRVAEGSNETNNDAGNSRRSVRGRVDRPRGLATQLLLERIPHGVAAKGGTDPLKSRLPLLPYVSVRGMWSSGVRGGVPERPKGAGCKPAGLAYGGSNPPAPTNKGYAPVAQ